MYRAHQTYVSRSWMPLDVSIFQSVNSARIVIDARSGRVCAIVLLQSTCRVRFSKAKYCIRGLQKTSVHATCCQYDRSEHCTVKSSTNSRVVESSDKSSIRKAMHVRHAAQQCLRTRRQGVGCHAYSVNSRRRALSMVTATLLSVTMPQLPAHAANEAVLNQLERLKREQGSQEIQTPALSRLSRIEVLHSLCGDR